MGEWFVGLDTRVVIRACGRYFISGETFSDVQTSISRPKPYDRPSRSLALVAQNGQDARATASQDRTSKVNIDGSTLGQLFQNLAPLIKEPPSGFDSKAAAICASLGLDPVTSEEIIGSFKRQFVASGSSQESRYVRAVPSVESSPLMRGSSPPNHTPPASGPRTDAIAQSTKAAITPTFAQPTSAPVPSTSATSLVPSRYQRPFSSGPKGYTVWYSTESNESIPFPPSDLPTSAGILYIHKNLTKNATQIWMCDIRRNWADITNAQGVRHPALSDRIFLLRSNGLPSWLTTASYAAIQARKGRRRTLCIPKARRFAPYFRHLLISSHYICAHSTSPINS